MRGASISVELYDSINFLNIPLRFRRESHESYVLLGLMEDYVNGAIIQWNRIQSTRMDDFRLIKEFEEESKRVWKETDQYLKEIEDILKTENFPQCSQKLDGIHEKIRAIYEENRNKLEEKNGQGKENTRTLFLDIHFYFICCDKVQNLIEKLAEKESNEELSALWRNLKPKFEPYNKARNHLEHIDTRLDPKYTGDMCNLWNNKFTFGGDQFDISHESLEFICGSYEQVLSILTE